jgi:hypothetical protein
MGVWTGCKGKEEVTITPSTAADLEKRCARIGAACGDQQKHSDKIIDECKTLAKKQVENGCTDKAIAVYDCYEKQVCGATEKVWALGDLSVLAERHSKCVAEIKASRECTEKK